MRIPYLAAIMAAATLACGGSDSSPTNPSPNPNPQGSTASVTIQDFSFTPATMTIKAGTTVTWTNQGPSAHTTVSDAGVWNSGTISAPSSGGAYGGAGSPGTFSFKFTQPGTFPYHCSLHPPSIYPNFVGTITVTQ